MEVKQPATKYKKPFGVGRTKLVFGATSLGTVPVEELAFPAFRTPNSSEWLVLTQTLAKVWNYPSSYQLIAKLVKKTALLLEDFLQTLSEINSQLVEHGLVAKSQASNPLYYIELAKVYGVIENHEVFTTNPSGQDKDVDMEDEDDDVLVGRKKKSSPAVIPATPKVEQVTVAQVFPLVENPVKPTFANYNCLTEVAKVQFYKERNLYKFLPLTKISFSDRELVWLDNSGLYDNPDLEAVLEKTTGKAGTLVTKKKKRDESNNFDFNETVLAGQGYFHEFNVLHICKVGTYYTAPPLTTTSSLAATPTYENAKMARHLQQLAFDNGDKDTLSKYFYTKQTKGPGLNYKDVSVINRINRIPTTLDPKAVRAHRVIKPKGQLPAFRNGMNIKGLVHEYFSKRAVDAKLKLQKEFTPDFANIEHLHNALQFNVLINSYRGVLKQTMGSYYQFKRIDFEQIYAMREYRQEFEQRKRYAKEVEEWKLREQARVTRDRQEMDRVNRYNYEVQRRKHEKMRQQFDAALDGPEFQEQRFVPSMPLPPPKPLQPLHLEILNRFTIPLSYREIMVNIPTEMRDDSSNNPQIKRPVSYITTQPDIHNPELSTRIEVVKIPNSNEIAWDNLRKFKSQYT